MDGETASVSRGDLRPRLVELVAALSLAADLGLGQPMEHGMRACVIATRLASRLGYDQPNLRRRLLGQPAGDGGLHGRLLRAAPDLGRRPGAAGGHVRRGSVRALDRRLFPLAGRLGRRSRAPRPPGRTPTGERHAGGGGVDDGPLSGDRTARGAAPVRSRRSRPAPAHVRALGRQGGAARAVGRGDRRSPPACSPSPTTSRSSIACTASTRRSRSRADTPGR